MTLHRRTFLRAAGVSLALPWLDVFAHGQRRGRRQPRRRMVCICTPLGLHPPYFFPEKAGKDYELTPYLEVLKDFRDDFTVVSGLAHAGMSPGFAHQASASFLTGGPGRGPARLSQRDLARPVRGRAHRRPDALPQPGPVRRGGRPVLDADRRARAGGHLAVEGVRQAVPRRPARRSPGPGESPRRRPQHPRRRPRPGQHAALRASAPTTATGSTSTSPASATWSSGWPATRPGAKTPKPKVNVPPPTDIPNAADLLGRTRLLFDLTHLALQTDSTRLITIMLAGSTFVPPIPGVTLGHHDLSHHGKDPGKLDQLKIVEVETMKTLRDLLAKLKQSKEDGATLLDRTMVFLGSNLGDGSSHSVKNLPVLLAGGGFRHGQHLHFDPQNPPPLCNLYVSMLQRLGIEVDRFSSGTGTLTDRQRG